MISNRLGAICVVAIACSAPPTEKPLQPRVKDPEVKAPKTPKVVEVVAGSFHTCARRDDASVWCWGNNERGQLGTPGPSQDHPIRVSAGDGATRLVAGATRTCAIIGDGGVRCWGHVQWGEDRPLPFGSAKVRVLAFGEDDRACAILIDGTLRCSAADGVIDVPITDVVEIGLGRDQGCARTKTGDVSCWNTAPSTVLGKPTVVVANAASLSVSWLHACAALVDGSVRCWGYNGNHQLGVAGHPEGVVTPAGVSDAVAVAVGVSESCALTRAGKVICWGGSRDEQLVTAIDGVTGATALTAGVDHFCAIANGEATCWGNDEYGALGRPPFALRTLAEPLPELHDVIDLVAEGSRTCARVRDGRVSCWGLSYGPDAREIVVATPTVVPALAGARQIAMAAFHVCVLRDDRTVACWGENRHGTVGDGTRQPRWSPTPVVGLHDVVELIAGYEHICARIVDGTVACWGDNEDGQLGDGTKVDRLSPILLPKITDALRVQTSGSRTCVVRKGGTQVCFGRALNPQPPDWVVGESEVHELYGSACAILRDGTVSCIGNNQSGELGDGSETRRDHAHAVIAKGLSDVVQLVAGHRCALKRDGTVWCWGPRTAALGLGSSSARDCNLGDGPPEPCIRVPTQLPIAGVVQLVSGSRHVCARMRDGTVRCWGNHADSGWKSTYPGPVVVVWPK